MAMEALQDLQVILSKCLVLLDFEASQMSDIVGEWNLKDNCSVKFGQQVQSNLVISNSLILNYRLSRIENLVPVLT